jgi:hypothetical protein
MTDDSYILPIKRKSEGLQTNAFPKILISMNYLNILFS